MVSTPMKISEIGIRVGASVGAVVGTAAWVFAIAA
jgi:hypothetical protein